MSSDPKGLVDQVIQHLSDGNLSQEDRQRLLTALSRPTRTNLKWGDARANCLQLFESQSHISSTQIDEQLKLVREDFPRKERQRAREFIEKALDCQLEETNKVWRRSGSDPLSFIKDAKIGDIIHTEEKAKELSCKEGELVASLKDNGWIHIGGKKMKKVKE